MADKALKLATRKADQCIARIGVGKAYGGRDELIRAFMPVAEIELLIKRNGRRMNKALAANERRINDLRVSFEQPPPPAFDPAELEKKVDGMVARGVNGFSFSDPPVPDYHPESPNYRGDV